MKVRELVVIFLFLVGFISAVLLAMCILTLFFGRYDRLGTIAVVPKWIFLFSPLVCLWWKKEVQSFLDRLQKILF